MVLDCVRAFVRRHDVPSRGERVLCALSGGADSVALLVAMARLAQELAIEVVAAHVDHRLRGVESQRDATAAATLAAAQNVRFELLTAREAPPAGASVEAWARETRRELLTETARSLGARRIALGHTRDDQAETVLFRALSGTSLTGLTAMRPVSPGGVWIRPLLSARRSALRWALRAEGISWVEDSSNRNGLRPRGRLRHEILPLLEERIGPGAVDALDRLAAEAGEADDLLLELGESLLAEMRPVSPIDNEVRLETGPAAAYHPVVRRYALRRAYERVRGNRRDLGRSHLVALERLLGRSGDAHLPGDVRARSAHGYLTLTRNARDDGNSWPETEIACPGTVSVPQTGLSITSRIIPREALGAPPLSDGHEIWLDADRVRPPLRVRPRLPGDRLVPFGAPGSRKVSDILIDRGIPRAERGRVPILTDEAGILWVVGIRRSDGAPIGPRTSRVLAIEVNKQTLCEVNEGGQNDEPS